MTITLTLTEAQYDSLKAGLAAGVARAGRRADIADKAGKPERADTWDQRERDWDALRFDCGQQALKQGKR